MGMDKTRKSWLPLAAVTVLLAGCASSGLLSQNIGKINLGDGRERVLQIMGAPGDRSIYKNQEVLQYCSGSILGSGGSFYKMIWLKDGAVEAITGYNAVHGACLYREVDWGQAPKQKIDIDLDQDVDVNIQEGGQ